jgi:tRNA pseudouridine38-40 synthase
MISPQRRVALLVEYDGALYRGSQLQANGPSIQGELERAIEQMTGEFARVAFAGRTDSGVHALGQVGCFNTSAGYSCEAFVGGLNVRLPDPIAIRQACDIDSEFDPRRCAISRRYRYSLVTSTTRSPLDRGRAWQVPGPLAVDRMQAAGQLLLGEQDFAAFASLEMRAVSTRRQIHRVCIRRLERGLAIEIEANAFLMHQVRRTVAALVDIGSGRITIETFARHLREARPGSYERAAPAYGLCLVSVRYEPPLFEQNLEWL